MQPEVTSGVVWVWKWSWTTISLELNAKGFLKTEFHWGSFWKHLFLSKKLWTSQNDCSTNKLIPVNLHLHIIVKCKFLLISLGLIIFIGGHGTLLGLINSFIHVVMYAYYMLSAIPSMQKYLWWKRYLTIMQIVSTCLCFFAFLLALLDVDIANLIKTRLFSRQTDPVPGCFLPHRPNPIPAELQLPQIDRSATHNQRSSLRLHVLLILHQILQ